MNKEAMKQALEALEKVTKHFTRTPSTLMDSEARVEAHSAITALRQALEQPDDEIDWKDQYEKQKRRAEMWVAKYEKDIGPVEMAVPMQQSEALKLADALEQDTRGYEPVTDAARELRRLYAENQRLKAQPADEPVAWQLSPTDIYDFAGWLTTRKGVMTVGSSCEAGPMAEAVGEYLKTFPERFNTRPQPADEHKQALREATQIATWLWQNFYKDTAPQWEVLSDICGVLSQIDNMVAGLKYSDCKPVAWMFEFPDKRLAPKFDSAPHGGNWTPLYTRPQPAADRATELLKRCQNEMRYAGWDKFEADNTARNGVYEQVKQYLEKNT